MTPGIARWLTLGSYVGLLILIILWYFIIDPPRFVFSTILSIAYLGVLLLPAYALFKNKPRVYLWSSYLMLIFFSHAIIETYANSEHREFAMTELVLSSMFFICATICVRYVRKGLL